MGGSSRGGPHHPAGNPLPAGARAGADDARLRDPAARGVGGPGWPEPRQGQARQHAVVPLVLPDGHLRELPQVKPWLIRHEDAAAPEGELLQTPADLDEYEQYSMCINCMLCYSACPIVGLEEGFLGPAAIALAQRYNLDSRDEGAHERMEVLSTAEGVWACTFVGECTTACPKGVDPAGAIQRYKLTAATESLKSFLLPWRSA